MRALPVPLKKALDGFRPNRRVSRAVMLIYAIGTALIVLLAWTYSASKAIPRPGEIFSALGQLWNEQGLFDNLSTSLWLNFEAIGFAALLAVGLAYATVLPAMRPAVSVIAKLRFLGPVGPTFVFILLFMGHKLKLSLMLFGMAPYFLTSMAAVVAEIPKEKFDHARTLRMSEWRVVWEVVILGTLDKMLEAVRQNAAMSWRMLTMVEGVVRTEGGIGTMLLDQNKHFHLPAVFALILVVLLVGTLQDYALGWLRRVVCPYADLKSERS